MDLGRRKGAVVNGHRPRNPVQKQAARRDSKAPISNYGVEEAIFFDVARRCR